MGSGKRCAVGQTCGRLRRAGRLGPCLRRTVQTQGSSSWIEPAVRALYTLGLVFFTCLIILFWARLILPKMERTFSDFHIPMPAITRQLADETSIVGFVALFLAVAALASLALMNRSLRWYCPILGRLYRLALQVLIWLGEDDGTVRIGIKLVEGLAKPLSLLLPTYFTKFLFIVLPVSANGRNCNAMYSPSTAEPALMNDLSK